MSRQAIGLDSMQDAHDFYHHVPPTDTNAAYDMDSSATMATAMAAPSALPSVSQHSPDVSPSLPRPNSRPATRASNRSVSSPQAGSSPSLDTPESRNGSSFGSFSSTRSQQRSIKDLVNRFNQTSAAAAASTGGADSQIPAPSSGRDRYRKASETRTRLQKQPRSPTRTKVPSGAPHGKAHGGRGVSNGLAAVAAPHIAMSGLNAAQPTQRTTGRHRLHKPLFGEVTYSRSSSLQPGHGISSSPNRRVSEGSLVNPPSHPAHEHRRSRSDAPFYHPAHRQEALHHHQSTHDNSDLTHKRSVSDFTYDAEQASHYYDTSPQLQMSRLVTSGLTSQSTSPAPSSPDRPSRIPVSSGKLTPTTSSTSSAQRKISSRNHFPAPANTSPAKHRSSTKPTTSNLPTLTARRYDPFASRQAQPGQSLKAFITADPPAESPPLRSSRPRQPVSAATTTASRAKAGQRFESAISSKQGSGSDSSKRRSKKNIPELGRVDFAERRARIQRAISANLPEDAKSDQSSISARSSISGATRYSYINDSDAIGGQASADEHPTNAHDRDVHDQPPTNGLGLSIEVNGQPIDSSHNGPDSAATSFDMSPAAESAGHPVRTLDHLGAQNETTTEGRLGEPITLLSQVMRMREGSESSASGTDIESSPNFSASTSPNPSEVDDRGSIRIMLDGASPRQDTPDWPLEPATARQEHFPPQPATARQEHFPPIEAPVAESGNESFDSDEAEVGSSPWIGEGDGSPAIPETPRKEQHLNTDNYQEDNDITPRQNARVGRSSVMTISSKDWNRDSDAYFAVNRILEEYRASGEMTSEMLQEFERQVSMLSPSLSDLSKMDGSDAGTIKILLDSLLADSYAASKSQQQPSPKPEPPATASYNPPPDRLMLDFSDDEEEFRPGTAIIYSQPRKTSVLDKKRDTHLEPQKPSRFSGASLVVNPPASQPASLPDTTEGAQEEEFRPVPPPKDDGYSPRSSTGHVYQGLDQILPNSARHSRSSMVAPPSVRYSRSAEPPLRLPDIPTGQGLGLAISVEPPSTTSVTPPPLPTYSPPAPPPVATSARISDVISNDSMPHDETVSIPASPENSRPVTAEDRFRNFSTLSRPPTESRRSKPPGPITLPPSQSMNSFQSSDPGPGPSSDDPGPLSTQPSTPNPELKRLLKRKNVIKELVDTEFSYHQDMKIIEDIYKGTVGDMITADDKKILFGNSDQVEAFSLEFYDSLRSAVTGVYVPPKSSRWQSKRGSFSTNNSGDTEPISDTPDEERDCTTRVGEVFAHFLTQMEKVYGAYLKNHDAANQRLAKLQTDPTVKCWLAECHNNASDITSAWDLDSLLVKPVQRILKYPLLLQQLVESTSMTHPDRKALEYSVKEIMNVTHRINEAKKRADLVEQMVSRKRKDTDVRSGLAKAFGRRAEKLKERVGIAEAYQDTEFDELAHRFGGHFIRLQVCMRDVQGSIAEVDKAVNHFLEFANALEAYVDVSPSTSPDIESKWRKFILAIRELAMVAMPDHKAKVQDHVIRPMLMAIELHRGPQNAIQKRKKRILDYAKCKTMEKAGQKPDKKLLEASELYEALNEQLKIDLPKLYGLTAELIKACLDSNVVLQTQWMWLWKEKLAPVIEYAPRPEEPESRESIYPENIVPAFLGDYDIVHSHMLGLGICNGSLLADAANFLSPQTTLVGEDSVQPSRAQSRTRRPSNISGISGRKLSVGSESSPYMVSPEPEKNYNLPLSPSLTSFPNGQPGYYGRIRSNSAVSANRGRTPTVQQSSSSNTVSSVRMPSLASKSSFTMSRPSTANNRPVDSQYSASRMSVETAPKDMRPSSGASYFTTAQERFSGMFSSAMPMSDTPSNGTAPSSPKHALDDTPIMFVAASLFEFNIDRARREAGYPYLTYVEGEVFDVVAQKGELWLAKNQDDQTNSLGWIWEQHFVILSQDA